MTPDLQEREYENGEFSVRIELRTQAHRTDENVEFKNVSIAGYNSNQDQLASHPVGTITSTASRNIVDVTFRAPEVPRYIVAESSSFWSQNELEMELSGWERIDEELNFREYKYSSPEDKFQG